MSNQFQSIAAGVAELKPIFQGPIVSQLNDELDVLRAIQKGDEKYSGLSVVRPLKVRRNQGVGATSDGGNLPNIGRQTTVQATIQAKFNYLRFGITGPMIKASQSDKGSFVRGVAYELEEGYNDLKVDLNRQFSWDGSGTLASVSSNATGTTTLVIAGRESVEPALKFVDVGLTFDILNSSNVVIASAVTVNSISSGTPSSATATLVLNQVVTCTAGDKLVRSGSYGMEIQGLLQPLDGLTTSIYGVDRSQYISYQGNVRDLANGQLALDPLQASYNDAARRGGKQGKVGAIWSDYDSQRMYQKLLTADKRYVNTYEGDGGFFRKGQSYLEFNGTGWVPDQSAPQRIFMLNPESWKNYVLCELEFADESGSMLITQTGVDAYEVRLRYFSNLFCEKPSGQALLKSYTSP